MFLKKCVHVPNVNINTLTVKYKHTRTNINIEKSLAVKFFVNSIFFYQR